MKGESIYEKIIERNEKEKRDLEKIGYEYILKNWDLMKVNWIRRI